MSRKITRGYKGVFMMFAKWSTKQRMHNGPGGSSGRFIQKNISRHYLVCCGSGNGPKFFIGEYENQKEKRGSEVNLKYLKQS